MKKSTLVFMKRLLRATLILSFLIMLSNLSYAAKKYSAQNGNWSTTSTWTGGVVPVAGDTVYILGGHTVAVTANLYSNSTYMFLVIVGTVDLTSNGKLSFNSASKVIIENGGRILGNSNGDTISIGTGTSEYRGDVQGNITGASYVADGHNPVSGEGTASCGCYASVGSCTITSSDGYKVHITLTVKSLVKPASCVNGYNYNVRLDYLISFSGTNIPGGGLWTLQGNLTCGSQTLFFDLPNNGGAGTTTTNSNPWRGISDCSTATTTSLGCLSAVTDIEGSGIASGTKCSSSTSMLPVKLASFTAEASEPGAKLSWITVMEKNLNYFEIERAQEDLIFHAIAQVEGKGGSDARTAYTYLDQSARNGKNYYRLKSVDMDDSYEYSDLAVVVLGGMGNGVSIYPTVVEQSTFNVDVNDDTFLTPVQLVVLNSVGTTVYETTLNTGSSVIELPSSVKAGVYVVKLSTYDNQRMARIVVR